MNASISGQWREKRRVSGYWLRRSAWLSLSLVFLSETACQSSSQSEDAIEQSEDALTEIEANRRVLLSLSSLVSLKQTAVSASRDLKIADRSKIEGGYAVGGHSVVLNTDVQVADILSGGQLWLGSRSKVSNTARSVEQATLQDGASIHTASRVTDIGLHELPFLLEMPVSTQQRHLQQGASLILEEGDHGSITVNSGAKLILSSGIHRFRGLTLEPGSELELSPDGAGTIIVVENQLSLRGEVLGEGSDLALVSFSENQVAVDASFSATVIAPKAAIKLEDLKKAGKFKGSLFGKDVEIASPLSLSFEAFEHWGKLVPPQPLASCITEARGVKLAAFGYVNYLDEAVTVEKGPLNRFEGVNARFNRGSNFLAGEHPVDSLVMLNSPAPSWYLGGSVAKFTGQEAACNYEQLSALVVKLPADIAEVDPIELPLSQVPPRSVSSPARPVPKWSGSIERKYRSVVAGNVGAQSPELRVLDAAGAAPEGPFGIQATGSLPAPGSATIGKQINLDLTRIRFYRDSWFGNLHINSFAGVGGCLSGAQTSLIPRISGVLTRDKIPNLLIDCPSAPTLTYFEKYQMQEMDHYNDGDHVGRYPAIVEDNLPDETWGLLVDSKTLKRVPWTGVSAPNPNHYMSLPVDGRLTSVPILLMLASNEEEESSFLPILGSVDMNTGVFTPDASMTTSTALGNNEWRLDRNDSDYSGRFHGPVNIRVQVVNGEPLPAYTATDLVHICPELGGDYVDLSPDMAGVEDVSGTLIRWGRIPGASVKLQLLPHPDSVGASIPANAVSAPEKPMSDILTSSFTLGEDGCFDVPAESLVGLRSATLSSADVSLRLSMVLAGSQLDASMNSSFNWELSQEKTVEFSVADVLMSSPAISNDSWGSPIPGNELILRSIERGPEIRTALAVAQASRYYADVDPGVTRTVGVYSMTSCGSYFPGTSCNSVSGEADSNFWRTLYISGARTSTPGTAAVSCTTSSICSTGEGCYRQDGKAACSSIAGDCRCMPLDASFWQGIVAHETGHSIDSVASAPLKQEYYHFSCIAGLSDLTVPLLESLSCDCDPTDPTSPCVNPDYFGKTNGVYYNDLGESAGSNCNCNGITKTDGGHCMSSLEMNSRAMVEGFGHFIASLVQYPPSNEKPECQMQYYKDVPAKLVDSANSSSAWLLPPAKVNCGRASVAEGIRWRNNECTSIAGVQARSTEVDWLGFFRFVAAHPSGSYMTFAQLQLTKRAMCPSGSCVMMSQGWMSGPGVSGWIDAAAGVLGDPNSVRQVAQVGVDYGVSNALNP